MAGFRNRRRSGRSDGIRWRCSTRTRQFESLEPRLALAAQLVVSEVMALNRDVLLDGNGNASDWIEIQNLGNSTANLDGYFLTDNVDRLTRWRFPAVSLSAGAQMIVFASGEAGIDPAGFLHTNFRLDGDGESVTLVSPDGVSVVSQLVFPAQEENVAYGIGQTTQLVPLMGDGRSAKFLVPTSQDAAQMSPAWRGADLGFDDSAWTDVQLGIGYGDGVLPELESVNLALGAPVLISSTGSGALTAERLTDGDRSTYTLPADRVFDFTYTIDLGSEADFDRIEIYNRDDGVSPSRLTNYKVTVHDDVDGAPGPPIWSTQLRTDGSNSGAGGVDVVTADMDPFGDFGGRYVSISKLDDGTQDFRPQMAEVEIYPSRGYDDTFRTNVEADMRGVNSSAWLRAEFQIDEPSQWAQLILPLQYDDGFVAYINGNEVDRRNAGVGEPAFDAQATGAHTGNVTEELVISSELLRAGANVLAVHALNKSFDDTDFLLRMQLTGKQVENDAIGFLLQPTPGEFNGSSVKGFLSPVDVDKPRGFYDGPFQVQLSGVAPGATLVYTIDGSTPSVTHGERVEPASAVAIAETTLTVDTTTTLRAVAVHDQYATSPVVTHSYLFLEDVIRQPEIPEGMPAVWDGYSADYEMDPDVVDDPAYRDEIINGLRSIPTLSIVTDFGNLWDEADGIYIHSTQRGSAWERPVSLEWIQPDGTTGFQVNAGIRMWGTGWAPHSSSKKHSFQLKFKSQYGPSKLEFSMFPDAPVDKFDDIVLRAQGSRSWYDIRQSDIAQSQYIRDAWARDTARDMGKLEGHATFVHLYLNGLYWGLYNPVERTNEAFGEEYLGGDAEDYDVINKRSGIATHATAGNMDAWNAMMDIADAGVESPEAYAAIQQYLDVDDFIDYMLIQQYATNHDGPDQGGNNMRAMRRRDETGRFTFHVWDMEYTMWFEDEHRNIDGDVADSPMRLLNRLRENAEFRLRYADHVQQHFFHEGALTAEQSSARWQARADEIYSAIIGESARWGDGRRPEPYTRDVEWIAERERLLNEYFPVRTDILLGQLTGVGLYPLTPAPELNQFGGLVPTGFTANVTTPEGIVFYTLDGSDPRLPGGQPAPNASAFTPTTTFVSQGDRAEWWVPTDASWDTRWIGADVSVDSQLWKLATGALGFETTEAVAPEPVALQNATATFSESSRPVDNTIDGDLGGRGWGFSQPVDFQGPIIRAPSAVWETATDVGFEQGTELTVTMVHNALRRANLGHFRLWATTDSRDDFADGLSIGGDVTANWVPLVPIEMSSAEGAVMTLQPEGSILVSDGLNQRDTYTLKFVTPLQGITGLRLETLKDSSLPGRAGPGRSGNGNAYLTEITLAAAPATLQHEMPAETSDAMAAAMYGQQTSVYARFPFTVSSDPAASFAEMNLALQYSDGFVAYLNGQEIARQGATGDVAHDSAADAARPRADALEVVDFDVSAAIPLLRQGQNVLAVHLLNASSLDASTLLKPELIAKSDLGLIVGDDVSFRARTWLDGQWSALTAAEFVTAGDLTGDGTVDAQDIDRLCSAIDRSEHQFDLNGDGLVSSDDLEMMIHGVLKTTYGDANLDGQFDSTDLLAVSVAGEYEDGVSENSSWVTGDWNCDGEFSTEDLIDALQEASYVVTSSVVAAVPAGGAPWAHVAAAVADEHRAEFPAVPAAEDALLSANLTRREIKLELLARDAVFAEASESSVDRLALKQQDVSHGAAEELGSLMSRSTPWDDTDTSGP